MTTLTNRQRLALAEGLLEGMDTSEFEMFDYSDHDQALEGIRMMKGEAGPEPNPKPAGGCEPSVSPDETPGTTIEE